MISSRVQQPERGVALVMVMAMIVIVTIILVAFVAKARMSSSASASFSQSSLADALVQDSANNILAGLIGEMEAKSTPATTNGITILKPNTPKDYLPELDEAAKAADALGVPNLVKVSRSGVSAFTNGPVSLASAVAVDAVSLNGRSAPANRWNTARLLTASQNAQSFSNQPPQWIYVNRSGPVKLSAVTPAITQSIRNGEPDPEFVIGRYAYRVYDISGLLDVNVAGFPAAARDSKRIGRKGSLAWIDLQNTALPGYDATAAVAKSLADWKGPATNYSAYADDFSRKNGFLIAPPDSVAAGANRFLSRQELVEMTKASDLAAQFPDADAFLAQTTVFSRELNAPSWLPDQTVPASPAAMNPSIAFVRVRAGKEFIRRDGTQAKAGEPLVKTRFPLSKLALFGKHKDAAAADKAAIEQEILSYFGLQFVTGGSDPDRPFDHWRYFSDGTHGTIEYAFTAPDNGTRECMLTLDDVAGLGREPNFFELLQAGILADSLGQAMYDYYFKNYWTDRNIARHVQQIGLNIIDQYDEDSDPTIIARTPLEDINFYATGANFRPDPDLCGVENIPYIQAYSASQFRRFDQPDSFTYQEWNGTPVRPFPVLTTYMQFQIWNPHRNAADGTAAAYRIVATGDPVPQFIRPSDIILTPATLEVFSPSTHWIGFSVPATSTFASPHLLRADDAGITASPSSSLYQAAGAQIVGFWAGDIHAPYNGIRSTGAQADIKNPSSSYDFHDVTYASYQSRMLNPTGFTFQLQRKDAGGHWAPVQTIPAITTALGHVSSRIIRPQNGGDSFIYHDRPMLGQYYSRPDPRTIRFGFGKDVTTADVSDDSGNTVVNPVLPAPAFPLTSHFIMGLGTIGFVPVNVGSPLLLASNGAGVLRHYELGSLWKNTATSPTYYKERGKQSTRVGDTVPESGSPNPLTTASARPIVLNRPFHSVAEIGYAYRDLPWKSLNFSQDVEGSNPAQAPADAALLDLFSLTESPARAGVVNLNAASEEVLAALLSGADLDPMAGAAIALSDAEAKNVAADIRAYLGPRRNPLHVIRTAADIAKMLQASPTAQAWSKIKREEVVAALADIHNGRTWNFLIDVVAQSGRFSPGSAALADFAVNSQRRLLMHVAIDRITGRVVDKLVENGDQP